MIATSGAKIANATRTAAARILPLRVGPSPEAPSSSTGSGSFSPKRDAGENQAQPDEQTREDLGEEAGPGTLFSPNMVRFLASQNAARTHRGRHQTGDQVHPTHLRTHLVVEFL